MVRPPNIRHSKGRRDPVTIDLDPADVKREAAAETAGAEAKPARATAAKAKAAPAEPAATPASSAVQAEAQAARASSDPLPAGEPAAAQAALAGEPGSSAPDPAATAAARSAAETKNPADPAPSAPPRSPVEPGPAAPRPKGDAAAEQKPLFGRDASGTATAPAPGTSGPFRAAPSAPRTGEAQGSAGGAADGPAPRRGGLSLVAAGIVGGIVVLAGAGALQYAGILPVPGSSADPGEPAGLAELRSELAALRDQVAAGGAGAVADPAQAARLDEVAGTVERLQTDLAELRSAISQGSGGDAAGLQALDQRMTELEASLASLGQAGGQAGGETVDLAPLTERIGAVESRLADVSETARAAADASAALPERIAALDERLAAIDGRVAELTSQLEEQASNPRIALAIAAAGLKAAIDRGDPFMTELETYASIAPDAPEIADLRGLAASGVPTRAAISQAVNDAAGRMIAAAAPAAEDAGFFGRLLDSMQSVVKVRPIGDVEGDDVGAIVARLEAAIRAGDYDRAVAEFESLPDPAKQAGAGFIADVRARQTADALVERALSGALRPQEG